MVPASIHSHPKRGLLENPQGRARGIQSPILKGKCDPKLEFPQGLRWGEGETSPPSQKKEKNMHDTIDKYKCEDHLHQGRVVRKPVNVNPGLKVN